MPCEGSGLRARDTYTTCGVTLGECPVCGRLKPVTSSKRIPEHDE